MANDDAARYLWALHKLTQALLDGLKGAASVMKNWDCLPDEQRQEVISKVDKLIGQGEEALGKLEGKE